MTGVRKYGYVYGGTVTFQGQVREIDGTAWSLGRCDEVRLRALAVRDTARTENIPLAGIEVAAFWFSEIVTDGPDTVGTAGADPFRPHGVPDDDVDPFRPGHPCTGDA